MIDFYCVPWKNQTAQAILCELNLSMSKHPVLHRTPHVFLLQPRLFLMSLFPSRNKDHIVRGKGRAGTRSMRYLWAFQGEVYSSRYKGLDDQ